MTKHFFCSLLVLISALILISGCKEDPFVNPKPQINHPFLIVTESQYDQLREKMATEPWNLSLKMQSVEPTKP